MDTLSLEAGRTGEIAVVFDPASPGTVSASLAVASSDTASPIRNVIVAGIGVWPPELIVTPDSLSVTLRLGESTTATVSLGNVGPGALEWSASYALPVPLFTFDPPAGQIGPGDSAVLSLGIDSSPLQDGKFALNVRIASNDPRSPARALPVMLDVIGIRPGDANADFIVDTRDIIVLVNVVFRDGPEPPPGAGDPNCDEAITLADIMFLVEYVFLSGPVPVCP